MSTSPRQAARCSGKHPLLSAKFVDASNCSSFSTTSLRHTQSHINVLFLLGFLFSDYTRLICEKHTRLFDQSASQFRGDGQLSSAGNAGKLKDDDHVHVSPLIS